jgi:hypothetical protein
MDDTLQELENELKRLSPRGPSAALIAALERDLGPAPSAQSHASARRLASATSLRPWKWASWSLAGVAALVAFALFLSSGRESSDTRPSETPEPLVAGAVTSPQPAIAVASANHYEPVRATSVLYDLHEGVATTLPDRTEGREVRYRYVDTYTWKNPATNASLRWSVPRDEVRLVRANLD